MSLFFKFFKFFSDTHFHHLLISFFKDKFFNQYIATTTTMGKLKRGRKNQKSRTNPIGKAPKKDSEDKKDENTRQSKILPLVNKLKSPIANDRSMALGAITVLCEDERMRKMLLKEKLVPILMEQCLNDNNDEVIVESFGLLRNLGIEEGYDVIKFCWRNNIWTSIEGALAKIQTSFKFLFGNGEEKDKSKITLLYDFTENILSLIVVLASGSDDLYEEILYKIDPVLKFVLELLNSFKFSQKLFNSLLEFIYEFSTESKEFIEKYNQFGFNLDKVVEHVKNLDLNIKSESDSDANASHSNLNLSTIYLEGIKFNNYEALSNNSQKEQVVGQILSSLFETLTKINLDELKKSMNPAPTEPIEDNDSVTQELSKNLSASKVILTSLEVSLDLITSILEYLSVNEIEDEPLNFSDDMMNILLTRVYPVMDELLKFDMANSGTLLLTNKILISLNNFSWLLASSSQLPVEWFEKSTNLWDRIVTLSASDDLEVQKNCLNVLWGVMKSLGGEVQSKLDLKMVSGLVERGDAIRQEITQAENELQLEFYKSLVGFLGNAAGVIGNVEVTSRIGKFLIQSIEELNGLNSPLYCEIVVEALDTIYEVFGDSDFVYDGPVFVGENYLEKLVALEPQVKQMYKKIDKNKYPKLKMKVEETWMNLGGFIQYKRGA